MVIVWLWQLILHEQFSVHWLVLLKLQSQLFFFGHWSIQIQSPSSLCSLHCTFSEGCLIIVSFSFPSPSLLSFDVSLGSMVVVVVDVLGTNVEDRNFLCSWKLSRENYDQHSSYITLFIFLIIMLLLLLYFKKKSLHVFRDVVVLFVSVSNLNCSHQSLNSLQNYYPIYVFHLRLWCFQYPRMNWYLRNSFSKLLPENEYFFRFVFRLLNN